MKFTPYTIQSEGSRLWLVNPSGERVCDLWDMQLLDFGCTISIEGGLFNDLLDAGEWRERLIALGLDAAVNTANEIGFRRVEVDLGSR